MNTTTPKLPSPARCPVCGRELPPNLAPSRCPRCLLRQGLPTQLAAGPGGTVALPVYTPDQGLPQPGETFGHYHLVRLLGRGGMGAVFAADDLESGRRVALKVLGHRLDSPEARARFFREGRLAASVNHPNSVYVFGTEDIAGVPVIAMELVSGGNLQERVSRHGPLPVAEAVDGVWQITAGLEAAQRAGVLHRDIKPSNCFVEPDGTVKIGDFGLSISMLMHTDAGLTATGAFLGTPAFASPEQVRGDELTVRSDIYSVGVTLYYLLTGHHPFEAPDMVRMLATVLERRAESPAKRRPGLPSGLCRVVLRCLEKDPAKRFRSYDELRRGLLPYASASPTPAQLGLRCLAYALDCVVLAIPSSLITLLFPALVATAVDRQALSPNPQVPWVNLCQTALWLGYFGLLEGCLGASLGKLICRLRVVQPNRTAAGLGRALVRALVLIALPHTIWWAGLVIGHAQMAGAALDHWMMVVSCLSLATAGLFFSSARRRNGFAGLHDLVSGTRVVLHAGCPSRPALPVAQELPAKAENAPNLGPYHVLERLSGENESELLLGFDTRLLRHVWIRRLPPGTPPVESSLRAIGRPGRLRWLSGKRTATEAWDAYEAAPGRPLLALMAQPQPWDRVRYWLLDLAEELHAASQDPSLPARLSLDQVWITADGRAKLLDFAAPGTSGLASARGAQPGDADLSPELFLRQVATSCLEGRVADRSRPDLGLARVPLALHASHFLQELRSGADLGGHVACLRSIVGGVASISRARRAALTAAALALPVVAVVLGGTAQAFTRAFIKTSPELAALRECLTHYHDLDTKIRSGKAVASADHEALATYIAGRFGPIVTNPAVWNKISTRTVITDALRADAERILAMMPAPTPEKMAESSEGVEAFFGKSPDVAASEAFEKVTLPLVTLVMGYANAVLFVIVPCLISSLLFRGGALVKLLGIVFLNRQGVLAPRWQVTARALVAWLPFLLLPLGVESLSPALGATGALVLLVGSLAALTAASVLLPQRGLPERLAGVWPVPR